jgi:uncharacterized protein HemX
MFQTKDTLLRPDWGAVGLVVIIGTALIGVAMAQDSAQQQEVQALEERITAYQTGKEPTGPTRAELLSRVATLEADLASTKSALKACKKAAE